MRFMKFLAGAGLAAMLVACGGGGGVGDSSGGGGGGGETAVGIFRRVVGVLDQFVGQVGDALHVA